GQNINVIPISTITKDGINELLYKIADMLESIPKTVEVKEKVVYHYEKEEEPFTISRDDDGAFVLSGEKVETLFKMTDFSYDESTQRFARQLRHMGVDEALRD